MEVSPLQEKHVYHFLNWGDHDDPLYAMYNFNEDKDTIKDWFLWKTQNKRDQYFAIVVEGDAVGYMGLKSIHPIVKSAEVGIVLGAKATGKGLGEMALRWLIDYGFYTLKCTFITLEVLPWNYRARRLYEKLGFQQTGNIYRSLELPDNAATRRALMPYRDKIKGTKSKTAVLVEQMMLRKVRWQYGI